MKAIKLYFKSPLRAGIAGLGLESTENIIHSDTLFGAIANALNRLNEDVNEFIEKVRHGEIRFSSCFPFNGEVYYLPAPHIPSEKKWTFIPQDTFEKVISGEIPERDDFNLDFMRKIEVPKVALDRATSNSSIYYLTAVEFRENSGLYFIVDGKDRMVRLALKYLEDEGIGGKKTWGLGRFQHKIHESFRIKDSGESYVTLSLTYPTDLGRIAYWKPVIRSGWVNTARGTLRKPKLIMASEGSIFREEEEGEMVDLDLGYTELSQKVGHKVYVNGKSFLVRAEVKHES